MFIGLDIGGTKIRVGLLDDKFKIKKIVEKTTEAKKPKKVVIERILSAIAELDDPSVRGIGVAIRGLVDAKTGTVKKATMMPGDFRNVQLASLIRKKSRKPTWVENDTNCFALAEAVLGAGKGKENVVGLTFGTGIGGGVIIDGKIHSGFQGEAGEIGHMIIRADSYKWNCGQYGCFESLCSGSSQSYLYKKLTGKKIKGIDVENRYKAGEKQAARVYKQMSTNLAIGLANVIHVLDPEVIVIGGGFGKAKFYVDPAIKQVSKYLVYPETTKTKIRYAKLGPHAGIIGAALLCKYK